MAYQQLDSIIERLYNCQLPTEEEVLHLCSLALDILSAEPNLLSLPLPITIVGDIHGQFYDLKELFRIGGFAPSTNYLFLGDYVDRGIYSTESLLLLLALKVRYPSRISLLRGNHESRQVTQTYGFYDECLRKYGSISVWRCCCEVFDHLPISAIISDSIFCVHGGLSDLLSSLDQIKELSRVVESTEKTLMTDLLWSDPGNIRGFRASSRGAGVVFGGDVVQKFCLNNGIEMIARAHQLVYEGFKFLFDDQLVTVWSAPNYTYRCKNLASILELSENGDQAFKLFDRSPENDQDEFAPKAIADYWL